MCAENRLLCGHRAAKVEKKTFAGKSQASARDPEAASTGPEGAPFRKGKAVTEVSNAMIKESQTPSIIKGV